MRSQLGCYGHEDTDFLAVFLDVQLAQAVVDLDDFGRLDEYGFA